MIDTCSERGRDVVSGAELFLRTVADRGTEFIFLNPGTDTFPIQEAYARMSATGVELPRLVMCPFEGLAATAAQGAYLATGHAQVTFVHVDVGTANAAGALNDAKANRSALVLCAGRSPVTFDAEPGARSKYINWMQDVPDQAGIVRNYVKNEQLAYRARAIPLVVQRAFQVAESEPAGPAYISFPREALMEETETESTVQASRFPPSRLGSAPPDEIDKLATLLLTAENPLILTGYLGHDPAAVESLTAVSEAAAVGVIEYRGRMNFPLNHPHHLGFNARNEIESADLLLVVEHDVPYVPASCKPKSSARIVHVGIDPYRETMPTWGFPSDLGIRADAGSTLRLLAERLTTMSAAGDRTRIAARSKELRRIHDDLFQASTATPIATSGQSSLAFLGQVLNARLPDAVYFEEAVTAANPLARQLRDVRPGSYFRNGGTYLGWGVGAALGYGLARPGRTPVALVGDGAFMFSVPTATMWFASTYQVPCLTVVVNNRAYNSVRLAARDAYPDGWQVNHGYVGTDFDQQPAFELVAEACGVRGFRVEDAAKLEATLEDALTEVAAGRPALLNVATERADAAV